MSVVMSQRQSVGSSEAAETVQFINGQFLRGTSGKTFENRSPEDGRLVSVVHEASRDDVDAAVKAARAAVDGEWGKMPVAKRCELLHAVADEIDRRFDDFLDAEIGRHWASPLTVRRHLAIPRGAANFRIFAEVVKNVATECLPHGHARWRRSAQLFGPRARSAWSA